MGCSSTCRKLRHHLSSSRSVGGGFESDLSGVRPPAGHQWALRRPPVGPLLATAHDMGREVRIISALAQQFRGRSRLRGVLRRSCGPPERPFYVHGVSSMGWWLRNLDSTEGMSRSDADAATDSVDRQPRSPSTRSISRRTVSTPWPGTGDYLGRQLGPLAAAGRAGIEPARPPSSSSCTTGLVAPPAGGAGATGFWPTVTTGSTTWCSTISSPWRGGYSTGKLCTIGRSDR